MFFFRLFQTECRGEDEAVISIVPHQFVQFWKEQGKHKSTNEINLIESM